MDELRKLIGSKLIDVEVNTNGYIVLYFESKEGIKYSIDFCPTLRNLSGR